MSAASACTKPCPACLAFQQGNGVKKENVGKIYAAEARPLSGTERDASAGNSRVVSRRPAAGRRVDREVA